MLEKAISKIQRNPQNSLEKTVCRESLALLSSWIDPCIASLLQLKRRNERWSKAVKISVRVNPVAPILHRQEGLHSPRKKTEAEQVSFPIGISSYLLYKQLPPPPLPLFLTWIVLNIRNVTSQPRALDSVPSAQISQKHQHSASNSTAAKVLCPVARCPPPHIPLGPIWVPPSWDARGACFTPCEERQQHGGHGGKGSCAY